jgi:response regulator RpfG family c-di-GMP phosphodiesterase
MTRVLIIDDDEAVLRMLRFRLKDSYEIIATASPEEGLILALQHKPDAILVDLMMPEHTGFEVCQTLAGLSFTQLIPVFVISGAPKAIYKDFCDALGAQGYFEKPIDFNLLQTRLAEVVSKDRENRRREARLRLRVGLKLRGRDTKENPFETLTFTENVSRRGFACGLSVPLGRNSVVEVFLWIPTAHRFTGEARLAWLKFPETPAQICGFEFLLETREWIF